MFSNWMKQLPTKKRSSSWNRKRISEVESNLSESDIDPFESMFGEMVEDSFH